jgi:hypothetical protein
MPDTRQLKYGMGARRTPRSSPLKRMIFAAGSALAARDCGNAVIVCGDGVITRFGRERTIRK